MTGLFRRIFYTVKTCSLAVAVSLLMAGCSTQEKPLEARYAQEPEIEINVARQLLILHMADGRRRIYPVSTARNGVGQKMGSMQTPLGKHVIIEKIGDGLPWNAIYKYGAFTGKYYNRLTPVKKGEDPILSRIIRIAGTEAGFNTGDGVDTEYRRIYIHGTPPSERPQDRKPTSRGCIRMDVNHVMDLFSQVDVGTKVIIRDK